MEIPRMCRCIVGNPCESQSEPHRAARSGRSRRAVVGWLTVALMAAASSRELHAQVKGRESGRSPQSARPGGADWRSTPRDQASDNEQSFRRPEIRTQRSAADADDDDADAAPLNTHRSPSAEADPLGFRDRFITGRQVWREYDLAPYTSRVVTQAAPQRSIVDWIMKQTGEETWHGEEAAVLSATRTKLRVFHTPEVQGRVAEIVDRFVRPPQSQVAMRVQLVACSDLDWRSGLIHLLKPAATGPEGQQIWLLAPEDAALLRERLSQDRQSRLLAQQRLLATNGQATTVETGQSVNYISGLELTSGIFLAYQPVVSRLSDGAKATLTPLWTADGSAVDVGLKLTTHSITKLHAAQAAAPLTTGTQNTVVQVPEVAGSSLEHTLRCPTSQVLLVSAGVQMGSLASKRGPFSFSSPATELLLIVEIDPPASGRTTTRRPAATSERPVSGFRR